MREMACFRSASTAAQSGGRTGVRNAAPGAGAVAPGAHSRLVHRGRSGGGESGDGATLRRALCGLQSPYVLVNASAMTVLLDVARGRRAAAPVCPTGASMRRHLKDVTTQPEVVGRGARLLIHTAVATGAVAQQHESAFGRLLRGVARFPSRPLARLRDGVALTSPTHRHQDRSRTIATHRVAPRVDALGRSTKKPSNSWSVLRTDGRTWFSITTKADRFLGGQLKTGH